MALFVGNLQYISVKWQFSESEKPFIVNSRFHSPRTCISNKIDFFEVLLCWVSLHCWVFKFMEGKRFPWVLYFHSTRNSGTLETEANGTEISLESFQKIRYLLHFRNANHSNRKFWEENSQGWRELPYKKNGGARHSF